MPTLLVFGARNLGRVLASDFAADGWRVAGVARSEETIRVLRDDVPEAVGVIADAAKKATSGAKPLAMTGYKLDLLSGLVRDLLEQLAK